MLETSPSPFLVAIMTCTCWMQHICQHPSTIWFRTCTVICARMHALCVHGRDPPGTMQLTFAPSSAHNYIVWCGTTRISCASFLPAAVPRAHFQRRPTYSAHLLANKLFDQDNVSHGCRMAGNMTVAEQHPLVSDAARALQWFTTAESACDKSCSVSASAGKTCTERCMV
jgi:hypothetical protein